ncbi:MAG TPA: hypothetical protein VGD18_06050, partial [Thiobacillaceae bacterium]
SNFYAGLIAAVITPVAVAAYWFTVARYAGAVRRLVVTLATLGVLAAAGLTYVWWAAGAVVGNRAAFAFPRDDLFLYSAKWWSYLVPPVAHPLAGGMATDFWERMGIREGLLEQQVTLGWGLVALAGVAIFIRIRDGRPAPAHARIPVLVTVAAVALVCSLSPERTVGGFTFTRPSSLLYDVLPMFRAYARFGVVVQLMAALLAGMGVDWLLRDRAGRRQAACAVLVALVAIEYAVWPPALWRDVLPTAAHRWAMQQQGSLHVLDCTPADQESASVQWLTGGRISALGGSMADCGEPNLAVKLANSGYTHLLARGERDASGFAGSEPAAAGFRLASRRTGGVVFEVTAGRSAIYTSAMTGLFPRERNPDWSWRWMGERATWTVVNTGVRNVDAGLDIEMASFHRTRRVDVLLNGRHLKTLSISPERRMYRLDMTRLAPGDHQLVFHPVETATVVNAVISSGDTRALSVALGRWTWDTTGGSP